MQLPGGTFRRIGRAGLAAWVDRLLAGAPALAPIAEQLRADVDTVQVLPAWRFNAPTWTRPGLTLVGDAAHSVHPMAGQGMNAAIADAWTLGAQLASVQRLSADEVDAAVARYDAIRRPGIDYVGRLSHNLATLLTDLSWRGQGLGRWMLRRNQDNHRLQYIVTYNMSGPGVRRFSPTDRLVQFGLLIDPRSRRSRPAAGGSLGMAAVAVFYEAQVGAGDAFHDTVRLLVVATLGGLALAAALPASKQKAWVTCDNDSPIGMPARPPEPAPTSARRASRQLNVGGVPVGGGAPVSVQSMTTVTADVNRTLQQIAELTAAGCQIVRVAVPSQDDLAALPIIARKSQIPLIADIHFQPNYVFAAIDAGCAAVRVNPGDIKRFDDKVAEIGKAAGDAGVPIRIGVNAGSLDRRLLAKYGKATAEALVESALWEASLFEEHGFTDLKISVKHNDPVVMIDAHEQLASRCAYPLHLGVTEAGPAFQGTIKSAVAFGALLSRGIGTPSGSPCPAPPVRR